VARAAGRVVTGFFAPRSHRVVPVTACPIHHPDLDAAVGVVRSWAGQKKVPIYDEQTRSGWLRHVVVRRSTADGRVLVSLVGASERSAGLGDLVRRLRRRLPQAAGLALNINPEETNVILGDHTQQVWGQGFVEEVLGDLRFRLSTGTFFQVHTAQARALFDKVVSFLAGAAGPVVDAYCGVGVLAQLLAAAGAEVIGIEIAAQAVDDARLSAERNRVPVTVHRGRVERVLPKLVAEGLAPVAAVLDPPRKGADPAVLQALAESGCGRIAYVSCHPGSLARDLKQLIGLGFRLQALEAVDMFPQTAHLETFAGLVR
jgi:23S rRNA (uracil1939-C5)-methyltransferase